MVRQLVGFCIGNGTTREHLDLTTLDPYGITVGCNELYKTYNPQFLVALDVAAKEGVDKLKRPLPWRYITRDQEFAPTCFTCDGVPFAGRKELNDGLNNNSGIVAAAFLAQILQCRRVYLVGVDFFQPVPGRDNDLTGGDYPWGGGFVRGWNKIPEINKQCDIVRVGPIYNRDREFYDTMLRGFRFIESFDRMFEEMS